METAVTDPLEVRIIHSWLSNVRIEYIAKVEQVEVAEVEKIVARAVGVPSGRARI